MIMPVATCFTRQQLEEFSLGKLAEPLYTQVMTHLENCPACEETVASLDYLSDSVVQQLKIRPQPSEVVGNPHFQQALAHVKSRPFIPTKPARSSAPVFPGEGPQLREYRLLELLGQGGMGAVYKAIHTRLERVVAVKVLPPQRMTNSLAAARFQKEMKAIGRFDHPSIVRATDAGDVDGTFFLVMEYVEGMDLSRLAVWHGPLPIADACELVRQAALGLEHVHRHGMVHRDVKPSNLMLNEDGQVKILDLGLARLITPHPAVDELTTVGQFLGTLDYMAPEQADDGPDVDIRADVYGLGATLYRLLCGHPPFAGQPFQWPLQKLKAITTLPAPAVALSRPEVPDPLAALVHRMLEKDPAQRPSSSTEVAEALQPFVAGSNPRRLLSEARERALTGEHFESAANAGSFPVDGPRLPDAEPEELPPPGERPASTPGRRRPRRMRRVAAALLGVAAVLLTALTVQITTDRGELIIESSDPNVRVLIKRSGEPVDDLQLEQGLNRNTFRSGDYEIVLLGPTDGLHVKDGKFTLTRGGQHVVTIQRGPAEQPPIIGAEPEAPPVRAPRYAGRTYDEWREVLQVEHQPEQLTVALHAFVALGADDRPTETAQLILEVMDRYSFLRVEEHGGYFYYEQLRFPRPAGHFSPEIDPTEKLQQAGIRAFQQLLDSPAAQFVLVEEATSENVNRLMFAVHVCGHFEVATPPEAQRFARIAKAIFPEILKASHDEDPKVRYLFLWWGQTILQTARDDPETGRETGRLSFALTQRLHEALDDPNPNVVSIATQGLVRLDPDHPRLVPTLIKHLEEGAKAMEGDMEWPFASPSLATRLANSALRGLLQLGAKAKGAVPALVEVVENTKLAYGFRQQAITTLGNIGPAASEAIPVLQEALEGDDRDFLGDAAMKALWKIAPETLREMVPPEEIDRLKEEIEARDRSGFPGSLP